MLHPHRRKRNTGSRKTVIGAAIALGSILSGCGNAGEKAAENAAPADYAVLTISPRSTTLFNEWPATIQGQQNVEIRPMIDGYLQAIFVDEGAVVAKGQRLFSINAPQYEQELRTAEADIRIAQADVDAARMEVNKVRPLVEKNIISQYELRSAEFTLQSREAALAQAQARLENARTNVGYTIITSPVDGVMGPIPFKIGSLVSSANTSPLTTVSNIGNIHAYLSVSEARSLDFSLRTEGTTIQERLATLPPATLILANGIEHPEKGRIETEVGIVDRETGAVTVRATFPNPRGLVRSGSSGVVRIPITLDSALLVPQSATYELQGKRFVYVLDSTNTARNAEITVAPNSNGKAFVVREGLHAGDRVVVEGVISLREGTLINPRPVNADSLFRPAEAPATEQAAR